MTIPEYISTKEACEIIGVKSTKMCEYFKKIREKYPNSIKMKGRVNRKDFNKFFNIGNSYRRKETKDENLE